MNAIIVDDHPLARIAIRNLLDTNGIAVTTELDSGDQAEIKWFKPLKKLSRSC